MQIDWVTVSAQIINFLVLVWILKKFLYGRVIAAMEARRKSIAEAKAAAEESLRQAEHEKAEFQSKSEALERDRKELMAEAREEADRLLKSLREEIRAEAEEQRREWQHQVESERDSFLEDLRQEGLKHFFSLAKKALEELADAKLEARMAEVLAQRLRDLPADEAEALRQAAKTGETVEVGSVFPLEEGARRSLESAFGELFKEEVPVAYVTNETQPHGIVIALGGRELTWTLESFVARLTADVEDRLERAQPTTSAA